jgi:hypothetical protein
LYIWHWPILVIFKWTVGIENSAYLFVMIFITIVMGLLSYHVIELPSRNFLSKFPLSSSRIFVMGVISIVGFAIIAALLSATQPYVSLSVTRDRQLWYPESWPSAFRNDTTTSQKYIVRTIFVFGDSHASSYSTLLKELSDETGVSVRQYSKGGCPVANFLTIPSIDCRHFIENTLAEIEKYSKPGDIVFLASLRMNRLSDQWKTFDIAAVEARQNGVAATKQRATALLEADQLVNFLTKLSLNVIIDAPKPVFLSPPFRCSDWFNHMNSVCRHGFKIKRSYLLKQREPVMYSIYSLKEKYSTLFIWDTFPVLCSTDICSAFDNENPLFFDGDHLSAHGNRILIPSFSSILSIIWWPS